MSKQIDERVVQMKFDNSGFERGASQTMSTLDRLKNKLNMKGVSDGLDDVSRAAQKCNFNPMTSALETVHVKFSALQVMAITTLERITNKAISTGEAIMKSFTVTPIKTGLQEYETQINAIQTILANTSSKGTTLEDVNNALDELNKYADLTIYNFTEMTRNIGTFTAAGIGLQESTKAIKGIANLAAVSGSTSQQASTAMYQLSQALATGTVKLMDWNSVVNAGMGGEVFKNAIMETARVHGVAVDQIIEEEGSFRDSLQKGWLSADILIETLENFTLEQNEYNKQMLIGKGYTEEQADAILKMAVTATDAATKVKTFTQLMDTLGEAAQSGWTQSWELILGDFEEAKEFFTYLSDTFSDIINKSAESRNNLLEGALSSKVVTRDDWLSLRNSGTDMKVLEEELIKTAKAHGIAIDEMIANEGSLRMSLKNRWLTMDILQETLDRFSEDVTDSTTDLTGNLEHFQEIAKRVISGEFGSGEERKKALAEIGEDYSSVQKVVNAMLEGTEVNIEELSDAQLQNAGYTEEQVRQLRELAKQAKETGTPIGDLMAKMSKPTGRELLIDSLKNIIATVIELTGTFKTAMQSIFPPTTSDQLYSAIEAFNKFTIAIKNAATSVHDNLYSTLRGLFAILDIGKQIVSAIFSVIKSILPATGDLGSGILDCTANIGEMIVKFDEFLKQTDIFGKASEIVIKGINLIKAGFNEVIKAVEVAIEYFKKFIDTLNINISWPALESMHGILERIHTRFTDLLQCVSDFVECVKKGSANIDTTLAQSGLIKFCVGLTTVLSQAVKSLFSVISNAIKSFAASVQNINFNNLLDLVNALATGGLAISIKNFTNGMQEGFIDVLDGLKDCLVAYQEQIKGKTLMTIASAIAVLAGSLIALSLVDSEKLGGAVVAITVLFKDITVAMSSLMSTFSASQIKKMGAFTKGIITLAASILVLSFSVVKIASLDAKALAKGVAGVTALLIDMCGTMIVLGKQQDKAIKGAAQMFILTYAVKQLASICIELSVMPWKEMAKGLAGVGILLAEIDLYLSLGNKGNGSIRSAASMFILAKAIQELTEVALIWANMPWKQTVKGLGSIGVFLLEIDLYLNSQHLSKGSGSIKAAASMFILAKAIQELSEVALIWSSMSVKQIGKGLVMVGGLLTEVDIFLSKETYTRGCIKTAAGMYIMAKALTEISVVALMFSGLSFEQMAKGLTAVAVLLAEIDAFLIGSSFQKRAITTSVGVIILANALTIMVDIVNDLGQIVSANLVQGLIALVGILAALAGGMNLMTGTLLGSASMLVMVAALWALVPVLVVLGSMPVKNIVKALGALAGVFTVVGAAGFILSGCIPAILGFGVALITIGAGVALIGAGLLAVGAGLTALALGITSAGVSIAAGASSIVAAIVGIFVGIIESIPTVLDSVKKLVISVCDLIIECAPKIAEAVVTLGHEIMNLLLTSLPEILEGLFSVILQVLDALAEYTPQIIDNVMLILIEVLEGIAGRLPELIVAAVDVVKAFFKGVLDSLSQLDFTAVMASLGCIGVMTALMHALAGVAGLAPAAMKGVLAMTAVVTEIGAIMTAFGGLNELIPGLQQWAEKGADLLSTVFNGLGEMLGKFVAGFLESTFSCLPTIGGYLSAFGENAKPFFDEIRNIDTNAITGVKNLADTLMTLTGQNILDAATKWLTGGTTLSDFGEELVAFGPHLSAFSNSVKDVNASKITASADAAKALGQLADNMPARDGLLQKGFGTKEDLGTFGEELVTFGRGMKQYGDSVLDLNVESIQSSVGAAEGLAALADNLPDAKGPISKWFGAGQISMSAFGEDLVVFGESFKAYYESIKSISSTTILENTTNAAGSLSALANDLPEKSSWTNKVTDLKDFGSQLRSFGDALSEYYEAIAGVDMGKMNSAINQVNNLVNMAITLENVDITNTKNFGSALTNLGKDGVTGFISAFTDAFNRVKNTGSDMVQQIIEGGNEKVTTVKVFFQGVVNELVKKLSDSKDSFKTQAKTIMAWINIGFDDRKDLVINGLQDVINRCYTVLIDSHKQFEHHGEEIMSHFIAGMRTKDRGLPTIFTNVLNDALSGIRNKASEFYTAGAYLVDGFTDGISDNSYKAAAKASAMASAAAAAARKELDEHSPSKVFYQIGNFAGEGFVNALSDSGISSYQAGETLASQAKNGLTAAVAGISAMISEDIDTQPTIRPVFDLSNIRTGTKTLNAMLDTTHAIGIGATINQSHATIQNGGNSAEGLSSGNGNTYNLVQNNYSPKNLSRLDIYRQTSNQFSRLKEVLG